jgi:hypothetical protein
MKKLLKFLGLLKTYQVNRVVDAKENLVEISPHWLFADRLGNRIIVAKADDHGKKINLEKVIAREVELTPKEVDEYGRLVAELHIA